MQGMAIVALHQAYAIGGQGAEFAGDQGARSV
jgi:hypothetical protein